MKAAGLRSFGNYPPFPQTPRSCHWRSNLPRMFQQSRDTHGTTLAYGNGLSYGDSCLAASDRVLHLRPMDRFINVDWTKGTLTAEAGVTLEEILAISIPRGWFLAVTPGTQYVTLGGAIANDVHGKNHHRRGTFGRHVVSLGLLRSDKGSMRCSAAMNPDYFAATIGGLGLTGLIEWAEIQLVPIRASQVDAVTQRFGNLDEFFALSDELDESHEFCVSWVDCAAHGGATGRGIYMAGDFAQTGTLTVETGPSLSMPLTPPVSLVNSLTLPAFNGIYWRKAPAKRARSRTRYVPFFYPLDSVLNWNRAYGPKGFQQYQAIVPHQVARPAVQAMLEQIARTGAGSCLAVLKRCGDLPSPGLLSFPKPGTTLALDFPQNDRLMTELFPRLDSIVRDAGGRLYPAKDAHWSGADFRRAYPQWTELEALRDPALQSRFWQRVTT